VKSIRLAFLLSLIVFSMSGSLVQALAEESKEKDLSGVVGRKWAFCIGVGKYSDPLIPPLPTASRDASEVGRALEEHGGFDEVFVLTDDVGEKEPRFPSRRNIQEILNKTVESIRPNDLVLFSFSGSGCTEDTGRSYLLTPESRTGNLEETAIPLEAVFAFIHKTGAKRSVLFLDAAQPGIPYRGRVSAWGISPDRYLKRGVSAVFYAAAKGYSSKPDDKSEHTAFAAQLLSGLQGGADGKYGGNKDGVVTLKELVSYVNLSLSEWCLATSQRQLPWVEIVDRGHSDMVLSTVEKTRVAKGRLIPAAVPADPRRKDTPRREGVVRAPDLQKKQTVESAPKVGAPAPRIDDLVKEARKATGGGEIQNSSAQKNEVLALEGAQKETPREELKVVLVERKQETAARPSDPSPAPPPVEQPKAGVETAVVEKIQSSVQGQENAGEDRKPVERVTLVSREEQRKSMQLRSRAKEVSVEEMKSILTGYGFYSTCWNYNGDFCNPSGDFENQFKDNGDGTVSDRATGLMWQKGGSSEGLTWAGAKAHAEKTNRERYAGHSDWRVPTIEELASLMESSWKNEDLFVDPVFDRAQRQCWSVDPKGMEAAWKANFHQGFLTDVSIHSRTHVRLVRTLQAP
jgi:hypothetical protein